MGGGGQAVCQTSSWITISKAQENPITQRFPYLCPCTSNLVALETIDKFLGRSNEIGVVIIIITSQPDRTEGSVR